MECKGHSHPSREDGTFPRSVFAADIVMEWGSRLRGWWRRGEESSSESEGERGEDEQLGGIEGGGGEGTSGGGGGGFSATSTAGAAAQPARRQRKPSMKLKEQAETAFKQRGGALPMGLTEEERNAIPNLGSNAGDASVKKYRTVAEPFFEVCYAPCMPCTPRPTLAQGMPLQRCPHCFHAELVARCLHTGIPNPRRLARRRA